MQSGAVYLPSRCSGHELDKDLQEIARYIVDTIVFNHGDQPP